MNQPLEGAKNSMAAGQEFGPYVVVRKLGAGGMGEVYLARHRHLDRNAAVKVLLPQISMNEDVVARFFTEARATAKISHPNIVEIFDCDVLPDHRAYIVMEFLPGESLRSTLDRVRTLAPDFRTIAAITGLVADALHAAHENGIVHRDLKPDNVFLTRATNPHDQLTVKVLDFGIAKLLSAETSLSATRTGSLIGTPLYMSPEQCRGLPTIGRTSDIYSLGCVLFEMVTGAPPFGGAGPGDILIGHITQAPPAVSSLRPDVPYEIETLVSVMLAKEPNERPQSMAEIVAAISQFLGLAYAQFGAAIGRPAGFPLSPVQTPTQVLTPVGILPGRPTPPPPNPAHRSNRVVSSPGTTAVAPNQLDEPFNQGSARYETTTAVVRPRRKLVIGIAAVFAFGLVVFGVYFLTRPPVPSRDVVDRPAKVAPPPPEANEGEKPALAAPQAVIPERLPPIPNPAEAAGSASPRAPLEAVPSAPRPAVSGPERARNKIKKQAKVVDDGAGTDGEAGKYERVGD